MKFVIIFYTAEPKPPEIYLVNGPNDCEEFFKRIVELTKNRSKFSIYQLGNCVGDFS